MQLTKHHGLANDFLVFLDLDDRQPVAPVQIRALCDRHRGVGADGVIRVTRGAVPDAPPDVLRMHLFNADGGRAEMSGNGIGCLAQAALRAGVVTGPDVEVHTDAGRRLVTIAPTDDPLVHRARVDMGAAKLGDDEPRWLEPGIVRAVAVDMGNPHLVLQAATRLQLDTVVARGREINDLVPGGVNVEFVVVDETGGVDMQVYERGVGVTQACGSGACAAAVAANAWGLTGPVVRVATDGGAAEVSVGDTIHYAVPVTFVAAVEVP